MEVIAIPAEKSPDEAKVRDAADRPIIRAAQSADIDILITGDKDFLEADIDHPAIMTPAQFCMK